MIAQTSGSYAGQQKMIDRKALVNILQTALMVSSLRFCRQTAISWLANFPGDIEVNIILAQVLAKEGRIPQAKTLLNQIIAKDPENLEATELWAEILSKTDTNFSETTNNLIILRKTYTQGAIQEQWVDGLIKANEAYEKKDYARCEKLTRDVLGIAENSILAGILHCKVIFEKGDPISTLSLASIYHKRWPECLHFSLILAHTQMNVGAEAEGVDLLQSCYSNDVCGTVVKRIWGQTFPYADLWKKELAMAMDLSIPADVASVLGLNILTSSVNDIRDILKPESTINTPAGQNVNIQSPNSTGTSTNVTTTPRLDETLISIESEFNNLAERLRKPSIGRTDSRFPVYVVLTSRTGLTKQYGDQTRLAIYDEVNRLCTSINKKTGWSTLVYTPDDVVQMNKLGLTSLDSIDPWKVKNAIAELDKAFAKKGMMIGALLIVGGNEIIPYHVLPNPTDDDDSSIDSDNPYSTLDTNYFVPEWPVGRFPGEDGPDAGLLLAQIRKTTDFHIRSKNTNSFLFDLMQLFSRMALTGSSRNTGYSAAIWRRSSIAVFRPIGDGRNVLVSPPEASGKVNAQRFVGSPLGYFNLHGLSDGSEWYGQKDLSDSSEGEDYPIALQPNDLPKNGKSPQVIFTEACYGGKVKGKNAKTSMALRFLDIGALAFLGSTAVAYGSVNTPLIGADLIGNLIWKYLKSGYTVGESFMQARIDFIKEMNRRQGYLDGEDQKTLISFVLLGDPLVTFELQPASKAKNIQRSKDQLVVKTICDRPENSSEKTAIRPEVITEVKGLVSSYLPGIESAQMKISQQHIHCDSKDHNCPNGQLDNQVKHPKNVNKTMVSFSKKVESKQIMHSHYARVTLDQSGKVVKLVVSR